MQKIIKRFLGMMMATFMVFSASTSAFAAETIDASDSMNTSVQEVDEASTRALGKILATNAGTINGGSGTISVNLPSGHFWANYVAQIGYTSESGLVNCTVTDPDGDVYNLGSISGSGSRTPATEAFYSPAGTYYFHFSSAKQSPYEVAVFIYE